MIATGLGKVALQDAPPHPIPPIPARQSLTPFLRGHSSDRGGSYQRWGACFQAAGVGERRIESQQGPDCTCTIVLPEFINVPYYLTR